MNPFVDTPRERSGLDDDDFLMMDMCESSGIMMAIHCFNSTKKACYGPRPGRKGSWDSVYFLGVRGDADLILGQRLG